MTGLCSFQNHWVCVSQEGGIETGRCAVLTHTPLWSSWGSKTGNKSLSPFSGPLGFSQSIALFEYLRFLEGSAFCSSKTTGTILGVEGHHPCATLQQGSVGSKEWRIWWSRGKNGYCFHLCPGVLLENKPKAYVRSGGSGCQDDRVSAYI